MILQYEVPQNGVIWFEGSSRQIPRTAVRHLRRQRQPQNGLNRYVISTTANLPKTIDRLTDGTLASSNLRIKFLYGPERQRVQELTRTMNGANSGPVTRTVFKAEGIEKDIDQVAGSARIRTALPRR